MSLPPFTSTTTSFTTISNSLPSTKFTIPTEVPSLFSFGPAFSCFANSVSRATPLPSQYPKDNPGGAAAACAISNDIEVNDHAFWDLYACCKSLDMDAGGHPDLCTAQCAAGEGQTWQEMAECLSKRVEVVVCKPASGGFFENGTRSTGYGSSGVASQTRTSSASGSGSATGSTSQTSGSAGAGSTVGIMHVGGSKAGVMLFAVLAIGSFAGMML
ncbi:hypothetical protein HBI04_043910 [Parastagonospora nodorum]|nr:hypothetical protein HBH47_136260 [Parastagonospora nodorum]KAH4259579.1 hypothetical protein HBI03_136640 [Parastagonospora nodorum]KAH4281838.1 hypothetical protein HBI04_043910 [Parastagonospora nodorum]KAH5318700.1 hypothetical protein HBI11_063710 [Parastagonospora nodorum]KAH5335889.1 hypothetical protein HBI50_032460 [Parastagonospora nodorum]